VSVPQPAKDTEVPAFWRALGLPGLADVHVHFLPMTLHRRIWAYFERGGPLTGLPLQVRYRGSVAERVAHLRTLGVRRFTALAYAHRPAMAVDLNAWALDFAWTTPECVPSATFYPEPGVLDYVTRALDAGVKVFKVHCQVGGFQPDDPRLDAVWGLLSDAAVPAVVHAGHFPVGTDDTGPEPFAALLRRHPRLYAIVGHMGAPDYEPFLRMAEEHERVALDTTMVLTPFSERFVPYPRELLPRLHALGLAGKVLLGSDFPNLFYPYAEQIAGLAAVGLGEAWLRAVCWANVIRVLGPPPDEAPDPADG
jgi:uncharacterized protein